MSSLGSSYSCGSNGNSAAYSTNSLASGLAPSGTSLEVPTSTYGDIPSDWFSQDSRHSNRSSRTGDRPSRPYAPSIASPASSKTSGFSYASTLAKATPMPPPPWVQREQAKAQANSGSEQGSGRGLLGYVGQAAVGLGEATFNATRGKGFRSSYNNPQYIEGGGEEPPVYYRDPCPYDLGRHPVYASHLQHTPPERNAHAEYKPEYKW